MEDLLMTDEWLTTREAAYILTIYMITHIKLASSRYLSATKVAVGAPPAAS